MKKILTFLLVTVCCHLLKAQSVGIGTSTPAASAQLDVASTAKGLLIPRMTAAQRTAITSPANGLMVYETTTSSFWFYNGAAWSQIGTGGASPWTVNGNNIYNSNTGNVGIGTATPDEKMEVVGNLQLTASQPILKLRATGSPFFSSQIDFNNSTGSNVGRIISIAGILGLSTTGHSEQLMLLPDGNITMGSSASLLINSIGNTERTLRLNDETPTIEFNANGVEKGFLQSTGDDINLATSPTNSAGELKFKIKNSTKVLIDINGNMGIGATPTEKLHVGGNAILNYVDPTLSFAEATVNKGFVQLNGDDLRIGTYSSNINGKFVVRTTAGDKFFIDNAGYAGINVTGLGALSQLHIGSGADANLTNNGYFMMGYPNGSNLIMDNNEIMARNNGAAGNLVLQNDGGTVRIGSTPVPNGYKFAINGKMICEELKVKLASNGWPDYVFNNNYNLKPLTDVEKFIQQNKHLPNIPSASEIEKNGIEVGDMQKRMMEKIEELTLYIIALQKQVDKLKKASN